MNRAESEIAAGLGIAIGWMLRLLWDLTVLIVLPVLTTVAIGLFWLHTWLIDILMDALDVPDSLIIRVAAGTVIFPLVISVAGAVLAASGYTAYFLVTAELHLALKTILVLMLAGAALSLFAFVRERLVDGADAELAIDFSELWAD